MKKTFHLTMALIFVFVSLFSVFGFVYADEEEETIDGPMSLTQTEDSFQTRSTTGKTSALNVLNTERTYREKYSRTARGESGTEQENEDDTKENEAEDTATVPRTGVPHDVAYTTYNAGEIKNSAQDGKFTTEPAPAEPESTDFSEIIAGISTEKYADYQENNYYENELSFSETEAVPEKSGKPGAVFICAAVVAVLALAGAAATVIVTRRKSDAGTAER